jgi:hypothetical protein
MANVGHVPMIEKPAESAAAFVAFRSAHRTPRHERATTRPLLD